MKDKKAAPAAASSIRTFFAKKLTTTEAASVIPETIETTPCESVTPETIEMVLRNCSPAVFSIFSPKVAKKVFNSVEGDENSEHSNNTSSENVDIIEGAETSTAEMSLGRPKRQAVANAENNEKNRLLQDKLVGNAINKSKYCTGKVADDSSERTTVKKKVKHCSPIDLTNTAEDSVTLKPQPNAFFLPIKEKEQVAKQQNSLKKSGNVSSKDSKNGTKKKDVTEEEKILLRQKEKDEKDQQMAEKFQLELMQKRMNESQSFAKSGHGVNVFFMQQQSKASSSAARRLSENIDDGDDEREGCSLNAQFVDITNCVLSNYGSPNLQEYILLAQNANYPQIPHRCSNTIDLTRSDIISSSNSSSSSSSSSSNNISFENAHITQVPITKFDFRSMCNTYIMSQKLSQTAQFCLPSTNSNGNNIASWNDICFPKSKSDMIGNLESIKEISDWLGIWAGKRRAKARSKKKRMRVSKDLDFEEPDILSNLMIICGPSGSGVTSVVSACAKEMGYNIIEINASQTRSGSIIKKSIAEATQSNGLGLLSSGVSDEGYTTTSSNCNVKALNLILFDEIDIVFEDDTALYSTIQQLVKTSKCPIILTTQSQTVKPTFKAQNPKCITFSIPESDEVYEKLEQLYSNTPTCVSIFMNFLSSLCSGDLRSCLNSLQFIAQSGPALPSTDDISDTKSASFSEWILDRKFDIAYFDNVYDTLLGSEASNVVCRTSSSELSTLSATAGVTVPIIFSTSPKKGSLSGGYVVRITGKNFLQRSTNKTSSHSILDVNVFIGGIFCESQIVSDTSIVAKVPALTTEGVYVISVIVGSSKGINASSQTCGSAGGWLNAYDSRKDIRGFFNNNATAKSKKPKKITGGTATLPLTIKRENVEQLVVDSSNKERRTDLNYKKGKLNRRNASICNSDDDDVLFDDRTGVETSRKRKSVLTDDDEIEETSRPELNQCTIDLLNSEIQRTMKSSIELLLTHRCSEPFALPVDTEQIYDYVEKIKDPMDLGTIQESLTMNLYALTDGALANDVVSFVNDVRQIWSNCRIYNGPSADLTRYANVLSDIFEKTLKSNLDILRENIALEIQNTSQSPEFYVRFTDNKIILADSMTVSLIDFYNDNGDDLFDDKIVEEVVEIIADDNVVDMLPETIHSEALEILLDEAETRRLRTTVGFNDVSAGVECLHFDDDTLRSPTLHRLRSSVSHNTEELECVNDMSTLYAQYSDSDLLISCYNEFSYLERNESADTISNDRYLYDNCISDASSLLQYNSTQLLKSKVMMKSRDQLYYKLFQSLIDVKATYFQKLDKFNKLSTPSEEFIGSVDESEEINTSKDEDKDYNSRLNAGMDEEEFVSSDDNDSDDDLVDFSTASIQIPKCYRNSKWHTSYSFIDSPYIRFMIRKNAYVKFVINVLTNFETGVFDNNNLTSAVCRELALDYLPYVGLMLHSDATRYKYEEPVSSRERSRTRLKSRKGRVKYSHLSELFAGMPDRDLDKLMEFSFVERVRETEEIATTYW